MAEIDVVSSLNANRRPDLRRQILDDDFQSVTYASCDVRFQLLLSFTYITKADWQFATAGARIKLKRLYPAIRAIQGTGAVCVVSN